MSKSINNLNLSELFDVTNVTVNGKSMPLYRSKSLTARYYVDVRILQDRLHGQDTHSLYEAAKDTISQRVYRRRIRKYWQKIQNILENQLQSSSSGKEVQIPFDMSNISDINLEMLQTVIQQALNQIDTSRGSVYYQIQDMYQYELFDKYFTEGFRALLKDGYLPKGCSLHHMISLSAEGENDVYNYVLILDPLHRIMHKLLGDSQLVQNKTDTDLIARMPVMGNVIFCVEHLYQYFDKKAVDEAYAGLDAEQKALLLIYRMFLAFNPDNPNDEEKMQEAFRPAAFTLKRLHQNYGIITPSLYKKRVLHPNYQKFSRRRSAYQITVNIVNNLAHEMGLSVGCLEYLVNKNGFEKNKVDLQKVLVWLKKLNFLYVVLERDVSIARQKGAKKNQGIAAISKEIRKEVKRIFDTELKNFISEHDYEKIANFQVLNCQMFYAIKQKMIKLNDNYKDVLSKSLGIDDVHKQSLLVYAYYLATGDDIMLSNLKVSMRKDTLVSKLKTILENKDILALKEKLSVPINGNNYREMLASLDIDRICSNNSAPQLSYDSSDWLTHVWMNVSKRIDLIENTEKVFAECNGNAGEIIERFCKLVSKYNYTCHKIGNLELLVPYRTLKDPKPFMAENAEVINIFCRLINDQVNVFFQQVQRIFSHLFPNDKVQQEQTETDISQSFQGGRVRREIADDEPFVISYWGWYHSAQKVSISGREQWHLEQAGLLQDVSDLDMFDIPQKIKQDISMIPPLDTATFFVQGQTEESNNNSFFAIKSTAYGTFKIPRNTTSNQIIQIPYRVAYLSDLLEGQNYAAPEYFEEHKRKIAILERVAKSLMSSNVNLFDTPTDKTSTAKLDCLWSKCNLLQSFAVLQQIYDWEILQSSITPEVSSGTNDAIRLKILRFQARKNNNRENS